MKRFVCLIIIFCTFTSCAINKATYLDKFGDINSKQCDLYFSMIDKYMINQMDIIKNIYLSNPLENALILKLKSWDTSDYYTTLKPEDFINNITTKNYYIIQEEPKYGLYEICIPKDYETDEGKKIWKCGINIFITVKDNDIINFCVLHETTMCKFVIENNRLHYISVDSSFGMSYSKIFYQVYQISDLKLIVNEMVFSSGSMVPSTIIYWKKNDNKIIFTGFSDDNDKSMFLKVKKEINLTTAST